MSSKVWAVLSLVQSLPIISSSRSMIGLASPSTFASPLPNTLKIEKLSSKSFAKVKYTFLFFNLPPLQQSLQARPGHPRFFLGSDSAPHTTQKKSTSTPSTPCAAGVYTAPILLPLVAHVLESFGAIDKLTGFVSTNGRKFYRFEQETPAVVRIDRQTSAIAASFSALGIEVAPFWADRPLNWSIVS